MTNTPQTEPLSLLDGVEPTAWMKSYPVNWDGEVFLCVRTKELLTAQPAQLFTNALYSRETVEALLETHRKQVLLEAAEMFEIIGYSKFRTPAEELRRMALDDKGEKNEEG